jgi:hypothetical protein
VPVPARLCTEPEVQSAPTLHARDEMGLQPTLFVKTGHHPLPPLPGAVDNEGRFCLNARARN